MSSTTPSRNLAINYVEMNVSNVARTKAFYGSAFGWTFTDYGPEYAEFSDGAMKGGFTTLGAVQAGGFQLTEHSVSAGGGDSATVDGCRRMQATFGEPVNGRLAGGDFVVVAGFQARVGTYSRDSIFNDGFQECQ